MSSFLKRRRILRESRRAEAKTREVRRLFAETLEKRIVLTTVTSVEPMENSHTAPQSTGIAATFDQNINATTATPQSFVVHSEMRAVTVEVSVAGTTITADPTSDFFAGELVQVTATSAIQSTTADPVIPRVWQFRTAVATGSGDFVDSEQTLGSGRFSVGDLDGDGDLDAFVVNPYEPLRVWINNAGSFSDSGQSLENEDRSSGVSLGDLDGDGDLDAFVSNANTVTHLWRNNGSGVFNQIQGAGFARITELGDLDGDGDLDAFVAGTSQGNVWLNNGSGEFSDNGQSFGVVESISLGDLDSDGDLDAFLTTLQGSRVWLNFGDGVFMNSEQTLGSNVLGDVSLGDLDGDSDLDALVASREGSRVWLNNGGGAFTSIGQSLEGGNGVSLSDLDGDSDLDAFLWDSVGAIRVWLNNGSALFSDSGQSLGNNGSEVSLGDLDEDGDVDAFVGIRNQGNRVWLNQNPVNQITLSVENATIAEAGGLATITATSSTLVSSSITVNLAIGGTAAATNDYTASASEIVIAAGTTTGSFVIAAVDDTLDEPNETVIVEVAGVVGGTEAGTQQVTITILDDDDPPTPDVTLSAAPKGIPEAGGASTFTAILSEVTTVPVTVNLSVAASSTATRTADYAVSDLQISIAPGNTSGSVIVTAVQDESDEPDETVTLEIANVIGGNELGQQMATTTILDDDVPPSFRLASFTPTSGGFKFALSAELDTSELNLGDTQTGGHGLADATLVGASVGAISGSLVVSPNGQGVEFLATGGRLASDTYTVTLRSTDNGFKDTGGRLLDGNADGMGGDDFTDTFTVTTNTSEIGVQDFVRGPGQELNLPTNSIDGIPITIDTDGTAVRNASFAINYNLELLNITGVTPGANMPAGSTATVDTSTPGQAVVTFTSPTDLPAGPNQLVNLQANVPTASAAAIYGEQHVLDINSISLTNAAGGTLPSIDNDGLHVAAFFGDVSGNGGINASDASQVARVAASLDSGFAQFLLTDSKVLGDVSGNGVINATDASMVARFAVQLPVDEIPPIPGGVAIAAGARASSRQGPAPLLTALVRAPVMMHDQPEAARASTVLGFEVPMAVPDAAVDMVMASLENPQTADAAELLPGLEDTVEQLLSASPTLATD